MLAIYNGKIYVPVIDGRLAALDAATGKVLWTVQTTPPDQNYSITMAPRIVKNKVIVGNAGSEYPVRGFILGLRYGIRQDGLALLHGTGRSEQAI